MDAITVEVDGVEGFLTGDESGDFIRIEQHQGGGPDFGERGGGGDGPEPLAGCGGHCPVAGGVDDVAALEAGAGGAEGGVVEGEADGGGIACQIDRPWPGAEG